MAHFNIEQPCVGFAARVDNPVVFSGWFADEQGRPAVTVSIWNGSTRTVCARRERPDVVSHLRLTSAADAMLGFSAEVAAGAGPRRFVVEAQTQEGRTVRLGVHYVWVRRYRSRNQQLGMAGDEETLPIQKTPPSDRVPEVKAIAFYLPQFHPIPENDRWWGIGFTEWTNVRPAVPRFPGHYQPHVPHPEIGYYDLSRSDVMKAQAVLARAHGVFGFCFYYYWFSGKRLLERPLEILLANPGIEIPFCYCWANENWSRRWDGQDREILIAQNHSPDDDLALIRDVARAFADKRYIRVNGKLLLLVYRPALLPDMASTAARWRRWCLDNGLGEILLLGVKGFGCGEPRSFGLDGLVEFPPNDSGAMPLPVPTGGETFAGTCYDVRQVRTNSLRTGNLPFRFFRGVTPSWDNTARRKNKASVFLNSSPGVYKNWLERSVALATAEHPTGERLLFINAWNEWAEGCHLEPDERFGFAWLNATKAVLGSWPAHADAIPRTASSTGQLEERRRRSTVTAAVICYNQKPFLEERFKTIGRQTRKPDEILFVDDASTDGSIEWVRSWSGLSESAICVNATRSGRPVDQWIKAAQRSSCDYLWIAEGDDAADPRLLDALVDALDSVPSATFVFCESLVIDERGLVIDSHSRTRKWPRSLQTGRYQVFSPQELRAGLAVDNPIPNVSGCLFRREALLRAELANATKFQLSGDWAVYLTLSELGGAVFVEDELNYHRIHAQAIRVSSERGWIRVREMLAIFKANPVDDPKLQNRRLETALTAFDFLGCTQRVPNLSMQEELLAEWVSLGGDPIRFSELACFSSGLRNRILERFGVRSAPRISAFSRPWRWAKRHGLWTFLKECDQCVVIRRFRHLLFKKVFSRRLPHRE